MLANVMPALEQAIASDRLAHAYILNGVDGGKVALAILQRLFCKEGTGCGHCSECERVASRNHADISWLEPESKSRVLGIEQIRDVVSFLAESSYCGGWKVVVIKDADRLTVEAANAFLKGLEEPAPRTLILLLTERPQGLLPTLISRCQQLYVGGVGKDLRAEPWFGALVTMLAEGWQDDDLRRLVMARRIGTILEEERKRLREAEAAAGEGEDEDVREARIEARVRGVRADILLVLLRWQRDLLVYGQTNDVAVLHFREQEAAIGAQSKDLSHADAVARVQAVEEMAQRLEFHLNIVSVLEVGLGGGMAKRKGALG